MLIMWLKNWTKSLLSVTMVCYTAVLSVVSNAPPHKRLLWGGTLHDDTKNGCVAEYSD